MATRRRRSGVVTAPAMPGGIQKRMDAGRGMPNGKPFQGGGFSPPGRLNNFTGGFAPPHEKPLNFDLPEKGSLPPMPMPPMMSPMPMPMPVTPVRKKRRGY